MCHILKKYFRLDSDSVVQCRDSKIKNLMHFIRFIIKRTVASDIHRIVKVINKQKT